MCGSSRHTRDRSRGHAGDRPGQGGIATAGELGRGGTAGATGSTGQLARLAQGRPRSVSVWE